MVSFKEVWPWNEFEKFVLFNTIRLKGGVNFFITEFLEVFYFPSAFIFIIEKIWKDFLRISVLNKCFQLLTINSIISL